MVRLTTFCLPITVLCLFCCTDNTSKEPLAAIRKAKVDPDILIEDVSSALAYDSSYTQGVTAVDINGDFYPEIFATNSWKNDNNFFYQNDRGTFKKDKRFSFTSDRLNANGACWGDFTRNGKLDLVVANVNNKNNQVFIASADTFGMIKVPQYDSINSWTYGVTWVDATNSGFLDLYVVNYHNQPNIFYQNIDGQLIESRDHVLSAGSHSSLNAVWADLDNNGYVDLIICGAKRNFIFKNLGGYHFEQLMESAIIQPNLTSYGCSVGDYDNDGLMDLFFTNWDSPNHLYRNLGDWEFELMSDAGLPSVKSLSEGSCWGDFDNDGWIDLAVSNDGENSLFRNLLGQRFEPVKVHGFTDTSINSNALVFFDSDLSGFVDLYVANGGNQKNQFFKNRGGKNHWVKIHLTGQRSNSSAIGSKVQVYYGGIQQTQEVSAQSGGGCGSQKPLTLHFGLGQSQRVDSIVIRWTSGSVQNIYSQSSNQLIQVTEPDSLQ